MHVAVIWTFKTFLREVVKTTAYLTNRFPCSANEFKTPMELWTEYPAYCSNLKVFGYVSYAHTKQDKLEARTLKCVFIGYPEGVKGFKLWNMESTGPKCFMRRDVTFRKDQMANQQKYQVIDGELKKNGVKLKVELPEKEIKHGEATNVVPEKDVVYDDEAEAEAED